MKLFRKQKREPRKSLRWLGIVLAVGLVCSLFNFSGGCSKKGAKKPEAIVKAFDIWAEENGVDSLLSRNVARRDFIPDYLTYVDTSYMYLKRRASMLERVAAYLKMTPTDKKNETDMAEAWFKTLSEREGGANGLSVSLEEEMLSWYERLKVMDRVAGRALLASEMQTLQARIDAIEKSPGYKTAFVVTDKDGAAYRFLFVSPEANPDSLVLFSVVADGGTGQ